MQALIDKDAIRDLVLCYSRGVDRQDFALLRTLYTKDAVEENHGGHYAGSAEGYIDWLETSLPRLAITTHGVLNHLIVLDGSDHAQGEVYCIAYHRIPKDGGGWFDQIHGMRYLDHYAKINGHWLFARRSVSLDWQRIGPTSWENNRPAIEGVLIGKPGLDDPSYSVLEHPFFGRRTPTG
jgi:hypothetical protein